MIKLIGVSGKLRHGKDSLANFVIDELYNELLPSNSIIKKLYQFLNKTPKIEKISFADPIKQMVKFMFPQLTEDDLYGPSQNRSKIIEGYINPKTGKPLIIRDCLTFIGAWGRSLNEDCWANATLHSANCFINLNYYVIISDCRYKNEKKAIEDNGGIIYRVVRPDVGYTTNDPSEVDLDDVVFDNVIINNSLDDLRVAAKNIVKEIMK